MDVQILFTIFNAEALSFKTKVSLMKQVGRAINDHYARNITEPIIYELVRSVDKKHPLLEDEHYKRVWEATQV